MKKILLALVLAGAFTGSATAGPDDSTQPLITNVFATDVSIASGSIRTVRVGVQNSKPSVVLNTPGYAPAVIANNNGKLELSAPVSVSTSATSSTSLGLDGAVVTLSTMNVVAGGIWLQTSDMTLWLSTKTISSNDPSCVATGCYTKLTP